MAMNSTGVSARFLKLFKEKVERKKYELNWDQPLTVNDVIQYVLGPETTRSGRGYVHMLRNFYPKEKTTDLIRRPADALVLHSSLSEYGVHFLEGLEDCFLGRDEDESGEEGDSLEGKEEIGKTREMKKDEIRFICVDIFTKVHQVELPPPEEEEEEIEEILENLEDAEDSEQPVEPELDKNHQGPQGTKELPTQYDEVTKGEVLQQKDTNESDRQNQSPRSGFSEGDDLAFYLNQSRPKTDETVDERKKMTERGGAGEGTPLRVESGVPSQENTPRVDEKANGEKDPASDKGEIQREGSSVNEENQQLTNEQLETSNVAPENDKTQNVQSASRNAEETPNYGNESSDLNTEKQTVEINLLVGENVEEPSYHSEPCEKTEDNGVLPEQALMIGALLEEEGEAAEEYSSYVDSRPLTRTTARTICSAESSLSVKTFSTKFQRVFVLVNWEEISSLLESIEILEVIVGHCSAIETNTQTLEISKEPTEQSECGADLPKPTIFKILTLPFTRQKLQSRDLYAFYQASFERITQLDMRKFYYLEESTDEQAFEVEVSNMTKCVQTKLFDSFFQAVDHRRKEVETNAAQLIAISRSRRRVPRENYPDIDVSDADWLIQLARSKWILGFKKEGMEIHETALTIKECLNGNLSQDNIHTLRELCDWALEIQDRNRAIELLLRMMEIRKQTLSDDNIMFSALFTELGHVQDSNGQLEEALESHSEALQIETLNHGSDHPDVATCQANIGRMYYKLSKLDLSIQFLNKALKTREFNFGPKSSKTAQVYSLLGDTWLALKDGMKALTFYEKSLLGREASMDIQEDQESILAEIMEKLGDAHMFRCDFKRALNFYGKALESRERHSEGAAGMGSLEVQHKYAKTLHSMSAYGEAHCLYNKVLQKFQTEGAERKVIAVLEDLGLLYQETGELVKARKTFLKVTHMMSRDL